MKNSKEGEGTNLVTRDLNLSDNIEHILLLCKENNMQSDNYATTKQVWDFQYRKNPIHKSWNAVIASNDLILGHIGLYPLPIKAFSQTLLGGAISNGVLSKTIRNKMLPYKGRKTFAVIPLIESCCKTAFDDDVNLIFVYSSIHSMIWKALKFTPIETNVKITFHSGIRDLYRTYKGLLYKSGKLSHKGIVVGYSTFLTFMHIISKLSNKILFSVKKNFITINGFETFDSELDVFFTKFHKKNVELITYQRKTDYLNWKFTQNKFKKFKIHYQSELVGYIVFESNDDDNNLKVIDFLILNEHINLINDVFDYLVNVKKMSFYFPHYLSCKYANNIFDNSRKNSVFLNLNPFRKKISTKTKVPLYYKINSSKNTYDFESQPWFITPVFFTPSYSE